MYIAIKNNIVQEKAQDILILLEKLRIEIIFKPVGQATHVGFRCGNEFYQSRVHFRNSEYPIHLLIKNYVFLKECYLALTHFDYIIYEVQQPRF